MIDPIKSIFVFCATLFFVLSPALTGGFNGYEAALFPNSIENHPAQPVGWTFAIWGVIYAWLLVMAGAGMFTKRSTDPEWDATRMPLIFSVGPGAAWIGVAAFSPIMATVLLFWMLGMALVALSRSPRKDRWLLRAPLGLYAGWLTAASAVSVAVVATGYGFGPAAPVWAVVALLGALFIGTGVLLRIRHIPMYAAALAWGLFGITVANIETTIPVAILSAMSILVIGGLAWRLR